jgi:aspartokinase
MDRIKLGGLKILDGRAYVAASFRDAADLLGARCLSLIVTEKINLSLLTQLVHERKQEQLISFCTETTAGHQSLSLLKSLNVDQFSMAMSSDTAILSVFPHEKKPEVAGALFEVFYHNKIHLEGVASSPSAISVVFGSGYQKKAIESVFEPFEFPSYGSPFAWHAAYSGRNQVFREVIASYEEKIIKTYGFVTQTELELWFITVPCHELSKLGAALRRLAAAGAKMPFVAAQMQEHDRLLFAFAFADVEERRVAAVFNEYLSNEANRHDEPTAMFHLHGPHFGDRFGIAHRMVEAIEQAGLTILAMSCTVASISGIVRQQKLPEVLEVLETIFEIPASTARSNISSPPSQLPT